jgi:valyl-tRNA synthetase
MIDKLFQHKAVEDFFYKEWEKSGMFKAGEKKDKQPYTIMMPPANVTGNLHLGHALTFTLQDILIRYQRMLGKDVLWQPGTDHAGIATQMVVERQLAEEGLDRKTLGREKFLERVWQWKEVSGGSIISQLKKLGASADWSRERFTMDPHFNHCVKKVFVQLYNDGLIYKDKRLVNWDTKYQTAVSDLEVEQKEISSHFYHLRYPIENSDQFIIVATTRPETFFGDTAVAVHPEDERYTHLIGKNVVLPITNRKVPIIGDEYCDPEVGTGAVKITPAHDFNDFEIGKRHNLPLISVLDFQGHLNENTPKEYQGLSSQAARKKVLEVFEQVDLIEKIEEIKHMVPHGDRSGTVIEPMLTDQWYVDAKTLAAPAIKAVETGKTTFFPKRWDKTYFEWLRNIQPWCISRQLWWGHPVPAWYGPDKTIFVAETEEEVKAKARAHYGKDVDLVQDTDVLDTWFSSALWPFVTLDWPEENDFLKRHYPGDVLITGFDIIFFWVARMMMMGLYFKKEVPFKEVYIHALIRDAKGQKMSKSKGNVIDPLVLIDSYGADAVRFCLASLAAPGKDIKLGEERVAGMRNFSTKLWNASRYLVMNGCHFNQDFLPKNCTIQVNQWIAQEVRILTKTVGGLIETYKFNEAAQAIYQFTWGTFCDWYVEFTKPILLSDDQKAIDETRQALAWCLGQLLHVLHPFMPFITEELWKAIGGKDLLALQNWPSIEAVDGQKAHSAMEQVITLITEIRSTRSELNVPAAQKISAHIYEISKEAGESIEENSELIERLARLETLVISSEKAPKSPAEGTIQIILKNMTLHVPLGNIIDIAQEKQRLQKEIQKLEQEMVSTKARLDNDEFRAKAPDHIIQELEERLDTFQEKKVKIGLALARL